MNGHARVTADASRNVSVELWQSVGDRLRETKSPARWVEMVETSTELSARAGAMRSAFELFSHALATAYPRERRARLRLVFGGLQPPGFWGCAAGAVAVAVAGVALSPRVCQRSAASVSLIL